jgi:hypothetical protein
LPAEDYWKGLRVFHSSSRSYWLARGSYPGHTSPQIPTTLVALLFDHEDRGITFCGNVREDLADNTAHYAIRQFLFSTAIALRTSDFSLLLGNVWSWVVLIWCELWVLHKLQECGVTRVVRMNSYWQSMWRTVQSSDLPSWTTCSCGDYARPK